MAEVFAGHSIGDHGFQKPVAIKRLLPELANDHVFVERLIEEAKLLVGMQHGNIVSVLDLARDGDDVFLVMEFVDGPSLRQLLKSRGQRGLPLGVATYVVAAAAAGLHFAHGRPGGAIIHADISPSNILLTTSGEVRVADFGIARREGGGHGIVEGKWAYMAPEQARGEPLTPRSDVFALGVVLYELVCGAHPFGRQVTAEERDSEPLRVIPPRVVKPSIPPGIDAICMRALAHDPRERYRSMQAMIDALTEERFSNQWREGASELATAIRECNPNAPMSVAPRTMVTDRPVTIATRSLIKELTPARRPSARDSRSDMSRSQSEYSASQSASVSVADEPRAARGTPVPPGLIPDSGAQTYALDRAVADEAMMRAAALMALPPNIRADGTPMPPFRVNDAGQDLASVVGGNTFSQAVASAAPVGVEGKSSKWTIGVLLAAIAIGVVAAFLIARGDGDKLPDGQQITVGNAKDDKLAQANDSADTKNNASPDKVGTPDNTSPDNRSSDTGNRNPDNTGNRNPDNTGPDNRNPDNRNPDNRNPDNTGPDSRNPDNVSPDKANTSPDKANTSPDKTDNTSPDKTDNTSPDKTDNTSPDKTNNTSPDKTNNTSPDKTDGKDKPEGIKVDPNKARVGGQGRSVAKKEPGILRVNSDPWSYVTVNGQRQPTVARFELPPGRYTVKFEDPDRGLTLTKTVTIESGKVKNLYANLEEDF